MSEQRTSGELRIAENALALIVALAATDIRSVYSLSGDLFHDELTNVAARKISKAIDIKVTGKMVEVSIQLILDGTVPLPVVTNQVVDNVKKQIEEMTGLSVSDIAVSVVGVHL